MIALALISRILFGSESRVFRFADYSSKISAQIGRAVEVSPGLGETLIWIGGDQARPLSNLELAAKALGAVVVPSGDGLKIVRGKANLKVLEEHQTSVRTQWIRVGLQGINDFQSARLKGSDAASAFARAVDHDYEQRERLLAGQASSTGLSPLTAQLLLPSGKFACELLQRIGLTELASVPAGEAAIFQDMPAAGTRALPGHQDLDQVYEEKMSGLPALSANPVLVRRLKALGYDKLIPATGEEVRRISKARVRVAASLGGVIATVEAFDVEGNRCFRVNFTFTPSGHILSRAALRAAAPHEESQRRVGLSEQPLAAARYCKDRKGSWPDWVSSPTSHEPLNLFVREYIEALARSYPASKTFVAVIPDDLWGAVLDDLSDGSISVPGIRRYLDAHFPFETVEDDSSVIYRPACMVDAVGRRASRGSLGIFAKGAKSGLTVRRIAELYHDTNRNPVSLASTWKLLVQSPDQKPVGADASPRFYWLLGAISSDNWSALCRGETLSAEQLGIVSELQTYLASEATIRLQSQRPLSAWDQFPLEVASQNGVGNCQIHFQFRTKQVSKSFLDGSPPDKVWSDFQGFERIVCPTLTEYQADDGSYQNRLTQEEAEKRIANINFWLGSQDQYDILIQLTPGVSIRQTLDGEVASDGRVFRYADLPQSQRDAIWKEGLRQAAEWLRLHPPITSNSQIPSGVIHP